MNDFKLIDFLLVDIQYISYDDYITNLVAIPYHSNIPPSAIDTLYDNDVLVLAYFSVAKSYHYCLENILHCILQSSPYFLLSIHAWLVIGVLLVSLP